MNTNYKVGFYQTKTTGSQFAMRFLYDGTQHNVYALITSLTVKRLKKLHAMQVAGQHLVIQ